MPRKKRNGPAPLEPSRRENTIEDGSANLATLLITEQEKQIVHLCIARENGRNAVCSIMGMTPDQVDAVLNRMPVRRYLEKYQAQFIRLLATREVSKLLRIGVTRDTIALRLFELGQMDPDLTKGSIDGQVKALVECARILGVHSTAGIVKEFEGRTDAELAYFSEHGKWPSAPPGHAVN